MLCTLAAAPEIHNDVFIAWALGGSGAGLVLLIVWPMLVTLLLRRRLPGHMGRTAELHFVERDPDGVAGTVRERLEPLGYTVKREGELVTAQRSPSNTYHVEIRLEPSPGGHRGEARIWCDQFVISDTGEGVAVEETLRALQGQDLRERAPSGGRRLDWSEDLWMLTGLHTLVIASMFAATDEASVHLGLIVAMLVQSLFMLVLAALTVLLNMARTATLIAVVFGLAWWSVNAWLAPVLFEREHGAAARVTLVEWFEEERARTRALEESMREERREREAAEGAEPEGD